MGAAATPGVVEDAARSWGGSLRLLAHATGGNWREDHGIVHLRTGVPVPNLNGLIALDRSADLDALADGATAHSDDGPWSVITRTPPDEAVMRAAECHGLTTRIDHPSSKPSLVDVPAEPAESRGEGTCSAWPPSGQLLGN